MALRNYVGNARATTIVGTDLTAAATSVVVASADNWPSINFWVAFDRGLPGEEKALCTSRTGTTLTIVRGQDNTGASVHLIGAAAEHVGTATDLSEANTLVNLADAKGDLLASSAADTWARVAVGTNDQVLVADSAQAAGVKWASPIVGHVVKDEGVALAQRAGLNFVGDAVVATDDAANNETDVAINHPAAPVHTSAQPHTVRKAGVAAGTRAAINFLDGTGVTITTTDDAANGEVDVSIANTGLVQVRKAGTSIGTRQAINFIEGTGINLTVADDAANNEVDVTIARTLSDATVAAAELRSTATFGDLTTAGPAVTLTTGTRVKVTLTAEMTTSTTNIQGAMGVAVSGATTVAASLTQSLKFTPTGVGVLVSATFILTGLTAGSNTFTAKYAVNSESISVTFSNRTIIVELA